MVALLVLLLVAVPLVELVVIIKVGQAIGALEAVALLVLVSLIGVWLVKRQGLAVLRRAQREVDAGRVPTASLLDGVLLLVAGGLLLFPGFVTDVFGVLLLLPPVRYAVRWLLVARYGRRLSTVVVTGSSTGRIRGRGVGGRIVDVDSADVESVDAESADGAARPDSSAGPSGPPDPPPSLPRPS